MSYDVLIVGAGPAGLSSAIHLKQLASSHNLDLSIAILEKGSQVGANIISGCVMDPKALTELIPNWKDLNFPVTTQVSSEKILFLTKNLSFNLPYPKDWQNKDNYVISLSQLCIKLAQYAENLGIEIYAGYAAEETLFENGQVVGVITNEVGLDKNGIKTANYQPGMQIKAKQVILAEGCRGSMSEKIIKKFNLAKNSAVQTYGLGIKEIWQVDSTKFQAGHVLHTIGFPLFNQAYGGGFLYHLENNLIAVGLVTALDYENTYLSPFEEFQKFKLHPQIKKLLIGAKRLEYGARTVVEGGLQALPELTFPGGVLAGDSAGFLNVPKIKGVHGAIKSGMLAADAVFKSIQNKECQAATYQKSFKNSWLYQELYKVRNFRPAFNYKLLFGMLYGTIDYYIFRGRAPWTFRCSIKDHEKLKSQKNCSKIDYPKPDNKITFDKSSSVYLSNISHDINQPCHLKLKDTKIPIRINLQKYDSPESRYCPTGVYEIVSNISGEKQLQINSQNCVHCKACDIKDPEQNIIWTPPVEGSGPQYSYM